MAARSIVLIGDSILDNSPYTAPEPDTAAHLRRLLGDDWDIQLIARDGATIADVPLQLRQLDGRADLGVLSIGGNDVTAHIGLLDRRIISSAEVLDDMVTIADDFSRRYEKAARSASARAVRTVLCTIYEVRLEPAPFARLARAPLAILNDRILRTAARLGLDVLELRDVCAEPSDFVLQIEPSATGAAKIAHAIAALALGDSAWTHARLFTPRSSP